MRDLFVSHSTVDAALASAVVGELERDGLRCWIAPRDIPMGMFYAGCIVSAIKESRAFLLILTSDANASNNVLREVECAVNDQQRILVVREADFLLREELEFYLAGVQHSHFPAPLSAVPPRTIANVVREAFEARDDASEANEEVAHPPDAGTQGDSNSPRSHERAQEAAASIRVRVAISVILSLLVGAFTAWWTMRTAAEVDVDAGSLPPASPENFNDPTTAFSETPAKEEVDAYQPALDPTEVTLQYVNESGRNLRLLLFDCARQYAGKTAWSDFPFDRGGQPQYYNGFLTGKGWFVFAVRDREGAIHYLGERKLFDRPETRLVVTLSEGRYLMATGP